MFLSYPLQTYAECDCASAEKKLWENNHQKIQFIARIISEDYGRVTVESSSLGDKNLSLLVVSADGKEFVKSKSLNNQMVIDSDTKNNDCRVNWIKGENYDFNVMRIPLVKEGAIPSDNEKLYKPGTIMERWWTNKCYTRISKNPNNTKSPNP
jgi:hypothetical protein